MKKTPQHFKREELRNVFDAVLKNAKTRFEPMSITTTEDYVFNDHTVTDFSFRDLSNDEYTDITHSKGKGVVDCLFLGLHNHFTPKYRSLSRIKLVDFQVCPIKESSYNGLGTDIKTSIALRVEVANHGLAEFQHNSRSMIYSSFAATLNAFQFYINCDRSFAGIQKALEDANQRNRNDIVETCKYRLSKLTEMNTYDWKRGN